MGGAAVKLCITARDLISLSSNQLPFSAIIELLIGEFYNQGRCDRHARQLYGSVAGNSGDIFFATCFHQFMIFCAKFYFSVQMATMAIGNANPAKAKMIVLGRRV